MHAFEVEKFTIDSSDIFLPRAWQLRQKHIWSWNADNTVQREEIIGSFALLADTEEGRPSGDWELQAMQLLFMSLV